MLGQWLIVLETSTAFTHLLYGLNRLLVAVISGIRDTNRDGYENEARPTSVLRYVTASFHPPCATVL
ncbi:MAG: hypothetical protein O7D30_11060, partial [Rickettsia endosymbiont of Ixodes persulcatus]|nr:hypothetical protein [Rickettsia endosymbiont of Ixodes persulcatus]